jgi:hypothetical protein
VSTREPDRDHAIERLLRQSLRSRAGQDASPQCLDAETLAAWVDGDLKAADIAATDAHVSACARCQAMVAALVRATPAAQKPIPWWRRGWVVGSLVPLTAGAIAIAIWIASPDFVRRSAPDRTDVPAQPAAAVPRPEPSTPVDRVSPSPPLSETRPGTASRQREAKDETSNIVPRDRPAAKPAAPPPAAAESFDARVAPMRDVALSKETVAIPEILSPDPSIRWRIGPSGSIQHSANGGATWTAASSGVTEDLIAGAAPSPTVCWIVGRAGTVLRSTDGLQFQRIAFPERADLVAIQATDALTATVTTADGRRFRTFDGGQTWPPLQEF